MKNFKKFALALVAVVLIIFIGLAFRRYWGPIVWAWIEWICDRFGVEPPDTLKGIIDVENLGD